MPESKLHDWPVVAKLFDDTDFLSHVFNNF